MERCGQLLLNPGLCVEPCQNGTVVSKQTVAGFVAGRHSDKVVNIITRNSKHKCRRR